MIHYTIDVKECADLRGGFLAAEYLPPSVKTKRVHSVNQPKASKALNEIWTRETLPLISLVILSDSTSISCGLPWMVVILEKSGPEGFPAKASALYHHKMHQILCSPLKSSIIFAVKRTQKEIHDK